MDVLPSRNEHVFGGCGEDNVQLAQEATVRTGSN